jgi:hypothetical protein
LLTEEHPSTAQHKTGKGKAGGPSGWIHQHIRAIVQEGPAAVSSVLRLVNALVAGRLPRLHTLLDSRLIAVRKRGGGIHPIAIQEV